MNWDCDRLERSFAATATLPDGTFVRGLTTARTRSCERRFTVRTPPRARVGATVAARVIDRFELGDTAARLCVVARCRELRFAPAVTVLSEDLVFDRPGRYRVALRTRYGTTRRTIVVGRDAGPPAPRVPTVLATGDSSMLGVEDFLADELGDGADVVSGALPGGRLSGEENGWLRVAREQVQRDRPDVVVLSIGANEGFSIGERLCCYPAWINAYAERMKAVLRTYRQGGRARVFVMTVQLPRVANRTEVFKASNEGTRRAAAKVPGVTLLAMDDYFTPDGYRETIPYRGRRVHVRASDGLHLNVSGQAIAARIVARAVTALIGR